MLGEPLTRAYGERVPPIPPSRRPLSRRLVLVGGLTSVAAASACTSEGADDQPVAKGATKASHGRQLTLGEGPVVAAGDPAASAIAASAALFARSPGAVVAAAEGDVAAAAQAARASGVPCLLDSLETAAELERLGVEKVRLFPAAAGTTWSEGLLDGREEADSLPDTDDEPVPVVVTTADPQTHAAAVATVLAAHSAAEDTPVLAADDPRADEVVEAVRADGAGRLAVVGRFDALPDDALEAAAGMASAADELPGGGVLAFPGRRMIALYGHPGTGDLGLLGEQDAQASVERAQELAEEYQEFSKERVVPAFEIIATVADSQPGADGDYSSESSIEHLRPWVEAAGEGGVYVVLDLQPGRTDFLTQAKLYEELLLLPHVGLALDPEWRLEPGQLHMRQIGKVEAAEVNEVSEWLAALVRDHGLPQKVLTLHQFQLQMLRDRDQIRTDHPELAVLVHADGHGTPDLKQGTWTALKTDLPEGMWLGWKNFIDEDTPTFTPEETMRDVDPAPWFVSYQ